MIRVLLADDHQVVRSGLASLFSATEDIEVVGSAVDGEQAVAAYSELSPDVVLMDVSMPSLDGVAATRKIIANDPLARVIMLTSFADHTRVTDAIDAGAIGYVLKDADPDSLAAAIRAAARGGSPLDPRVAAGLLRGRRNAHAMELTTREREVLRLVTKGLLNKQIAREMGISEKTVKAHLGRVFQRLGVTDRTQAALWAQRNGIFAEGDQV